MILRVASRVAPPGVTVALYAGLDTLPYFNPDLDRTLDDPALPPPVRAFRRSIAAADALLMSSPEYAHGVSGVMKNALDWLVGGSEMVEKRVAVLNTAPHATHAFAALLETLRTMTASVVTEACVAIAVPRDHDEEHLASKSAVVDALQHALRALTVPR